MIFSGTTPNDIYEWIDKKNNGDDTDYLNGKQDTEEAIDVFQSLYRHTFKNVYRLFLHLCQHLCMRVADSQSLYRAFIVLRNDEIITFRLSQHFSTKDATRRAFKRTRKPNVEYHLTINRVKSLNPNTDIYYDRMLSNVEIKVREYDLSEFNDRDIRKGIIDEIIALLTYGTNKNENKQYMNMNKQIIRLTEGDLHKIIKESVSKILKEYTSNGTVEESAVNEVKYDGVSYHGTNPYDWVDVAKERQYKARGEEDKVSQYNRERFKAKDNGDFMGAENASNNADTHRQQWRLQNKKMNRNYDNAKQLGWKGVDWEGNGDTRLGKAQEYYNMGQNAQTPQDRQRYNKMAQDTLGDVEGRAQKSLNMLRAARGQA